MTDAAPPPDPEHARALRARVAALEAALAQAEARATAVQALLACEGLDQLWATLARALREEAPALTLHVPLDPADRWGRFVPWSGDGAAVEVPACAALRTGRLRPAGVPGCAHLDPDAAACVAVSGPGRPCALAIVPAEPPVAIHALDRLAHAVGPAVEAALERSALALAAQVDPLTGLLNRGAFEREAQRIVARAARDGSPWAAILLDLDRFKRVNDTWGHAAGDRVLVATAGALLGAVRRSDVVGRVGGEEFAVVLEGCDRETARLRAEALRRALREAVSTPDGPVTASLGVAAAGPDDADLWAVIDRADGAMYAAKAAGRDRVRVHGAAEEGGA